MSQGSELVSLIKEIVENNSLKIELALVKALHPADDRSFLKITCETFPAGQEVIARMTWQAVGPNAGDFQFPEVEDLVLVAYASDDEDSAFILSRLTSKTDTIPTNALTKDRVIRSLAGKKIWITSDEKIYLGRGDAAPDERLVLGDTFKGTYADDIQNTIDALNEISDQIQEEATHFHIGFLGIPTAIPNNAAAMAAIKVNLDAVITSLSTLKSSEVESEDFLSDLSYTEK